MTLPEHSLRVHIPEEQLHVRVEEMVDELSHVLRDQKVVIVGVLRGSFMFLADLVRHLHPMGLHPQIDFMTLKSYGAAMESSGHVEIRKDITVDISGTTVLVVDDILDSGRTLDFAVRHLLDKGADKVISCCLLNKPARRIIEIEADVTGFTIPDLFVVGYGLDYDSHYRELPYLAEVVLEKSSEA